MTEESSTWRVASYTGGQGNCVEVGQAASAVVVRDTKNREAEVLRLSPAAWRNFTVTLAG